MMTMTQSIHSNIITLHDAIADTLVYRAATLHFDKQLDAFSRWINDLAQQTKSYSEKLKQLNAETISLTTKLNPTAMVNDYLLDSKITGLAATNYGDALKTNLSFKLKTVSDLEGNFTQPIQHFASQHIRDFKDFRDRHERALKKYEDALARYASFNGDLNDSATTQLDEARKTYVEMSSEHVLRIIKLRHELEHFLIQQFSTSTASRKEFFDDAQVWNQIDTILFSWTRWLAEDKRTSRFEIQKQQLAQQTLEKEYLEGVQLKFGDVEKIKTQSTTCWKSGYLWIKPADGTASSDWNRRWFFVHEGYFGSCKVTDPERNASITVDNCIPLRTCHAKPAPDTLNRRFCFEVISGQQPYKSMFVLQAENQQDLTEWMAAFIPKTTSPPLSTSINNDNKHGRPSSIIIGSYDSGNDQSRPRSPALLLSKSKSTTVVTIPVTLSTISSSSSSTSAFSNISNLSTSPSGSTIHSILSRPHSITTSAAASRVKITCSLSSSTPLLLREITKNHSPLESQLDESPTNNDKLWGTPRYVFSHENQQHTKSTPDDEKKAPVFILSQDPDTLNYLHDKTHELRSLFYGVSEEDMVMEVFMASYLKREPLPTISSGHQNNNRSSIMSLNSGYYYGGCVYVTQDTLWFYSKTSFNCITSVVIKLKDIEEIHVNHHTTKVTIDIVDSGDPTTPPLVFSLVHDDVSAVAKKLRFLVYNVKLDSPMSLKSIHQRIITMSTPTPSLSSTISTTEPSSLNESPCSSFLTSHTKDTPPCLSSRMASTTTTATMDTTETLVTSTSATTMAMTKKTPTINNKPTSKRFIDPDTMPNHISKPSAPVSCNCLNHLDRCEAQVELPISAKRLYELMFSDESTGPSTDGGVWDRKTKGIYGRDLRISRWEYTDSDDGDADQQLERPMKRVLKYWMPVANPIVRVKEAEVVETQSLLKKNDYLCYVIQISTKTESLPFADAFVPSLRYCITYINDSRCQLTCSMGVKWLKWIMAKMIVTRAALSGMSESINVFIPILNEEARTIQLSVDNIRQLELNLVDKASSDDGTTDTKNDMPTTTTSFTPHQYIGTAHRSTTVNNQSTNRNRQLSNTRPLPQCQHPAPHTKSIATTSTSTNNSDILYTPITEKMTTTTLAISSTLKLKTTRLHQLIKNSVLNASYQIAPPTLIKKATGILRPFDMRTFSGAIVIGYLIYTIVACLVTFSGTRLDNTSSPVTRNQVVVHAVYLRDLDEGFIKNSLQPPYSESNSYKLFLESRQGGQHYTWYDGRYYRLAQEYDTNREQLGILRQGVINMFQAVNTADSYLLENEYLNWLLDYRQRCRHERKLMQQYTLEYSDTSSHLCDQINSQIGTYF